MKTKLSHSIVPTLATALVILGVVITVYLLFTVEGSENRNSFMMLVMFGFVPIAAGIAFFVRYSRRKSFIKRMVQAARKHQGLVSIEQLIDDTKILPLEIEHILAVLLRNGKVRMVKSEKDTLYDFKPFLNTTEFA